MTKKTKILCSIVCFISIIATVLSGCASSSNKPDKGFGEDLYSADTDNETSRKDPDNKETTHKESTYEETTQEETTQEEINYEDYFEYCYLSDGTFGIVSVNSDCPDIVTLPSVYNGKAITQILPDAFANSKELKSVIIPNGIKVIGENAFKDCTNLINIAIPQSIVSIEDGAFYGCTNIINVVYEGTTDEASGLFSSLNSNKHMFGNFVCTDGLFVLPATIKQAVYNTYTATMPSNWNELSYYNDNDTQIISYIGSSFFEYDYKFENDEKYNVDGSINKDAIVPGAYTVNYSAATKLEDVTSTVASKWGYTSAQKAEGGYAWKITLRDDLKWDDGTPIKAADFVYSMKQALDPDFMNYRANTYYESLMIKNSRAYFIQNQKGTYETIGDFGFASLADAIASGKDIFANAWNMWGAAGYTDANGNECPEWLNITDETIYNNANGSDPVSGKFLYENYGGYLEPGTGYEAAVYIENNGQDVEWENVGIYSIDSENAIVICLDQKYSFLTKDGELSVWAPYYLSNLPLVHRNKYEATKIAPVDTETLWTSMYNTSLETTASWGPYKLVEFYPGSHYRLEKNENWYGWNMELYKNQYNVSAIYCRKMEEFYTQWMSFLAGVVDNASLQAENVGEYLNSKYVYHSYTSTGTFGMQLYSNLDVLKNSENNNGILAIQEFRHAFNLAINRSDIVENIWPGTAVPCFGLLNTAYYYDIENSPILADGGQYRNTVVAKEGILRAYGFTEDANGRWSCGDLKDLSLEDAYDSLTGYNPVLAKEKMVEAIAILTSDPEKYGYDSSKNITLIFGASVDNYKQRFRCEYLQDIIDGLTYGTVLEDKIDVVFDASAGIEWADAFRSGATQIGFGFGFTGDPFNPFDIVGSFVNPEDSLNYHRYWDTSAIDMTLTMPAGDYTGAGETITMSVQNWYFCLNGLAATENQPKTYNWGEDYAPVEARVLILSALEEITLKESRSIMLIADSSASFLGAKFSYFSEDEHTFMGFGGIRYMEVNYTDEEWAEFVNDNSNDLSHEYQKEY